jgi:very-short-patch-repair endonuclease
VDKLIVASEALAQGAVNRYALKTRYVKLYRNVYARADADLTAADRARAAWLWSNRSAIAVGHSAAALLGSKWLPDDLPAELARVRHPSPTGIVIHSGAIADDETCRQAGISCTTAPRTAYDFGRRLTGDTAIIRIDALLNATRCKVAEVEAIAERYRGARGIRRLRCTLKFVDGGAESPQETRLRLLLVRDRLPDLTTQIPVMNDSGRVVRRIDMGWPEWMVGVEYDGEHHFTNPDDYAADIERLEFLASKRWTIVRVSARQLRYDAAGILSRVRNALKENGCRAPRLR